MAPRKKGSNRRFLYMDFGSLPIENSDFVKKWSENSITRSKMAKFSACGGLRHGDWYKNNIIMLKNAARRAAIFFKGYFSMYGENQNKNPAWDMSGKITIFCRRVLSQKKWFERTRKIRCQSERLPVSFSIINPEVPIWSDYRYLFYKSVQRCQSAAITSTLFYISVQRCFKKRDISLLLKIKCVNAQRLRGGFNINRLYRIPHVIAADLHI